MSSDPNQQKVKDSPTIEQLQSEIASLQQKLERLERIEREHIWQTSFLHKLVNLIPLGVAMHSGGVVTYINQAGLQIMRAKSVEDILDKPAIEFVHPDYRAMALERIDALKRSSEDPPFPTAPYQEEKFICVDGTVIDVEVAAFPLHMADDDISLLVLFRDITERKQQQRALEEREARFRQLIELLPVATVIHKNDTIFFANRTAADLFQIESREDAVGRSVFDFLHPDEYDSVRNRLNTLMQSRGDLPVTIEKLLRSDGSTFLAEVAAFPFVEDGELAVLVVMRDVTEQERMLKELEKSESRFRSLAELLPATVFVVDRDSNLIYVNAASKTTLGFSLDELLSADLPALLDESSFQETKQIVDDMPIGESAHYEMRVKDKSGKWQWLDVYLTKTIFDDEIVSLGVATNATWRKETEMLLKQQAQKLVSAYEEERARIARELHDEIGQQLIGMKFVLERAQHFSSTSEVQESLTTASQILANLTETVRELSLTFRPSQLDDLGLLPTLVWHFKRYTDRTGIKVNFSHVGLENQRFSQTVEITVYRVIQESLTNVARHARTNVVNVLVHADDVGIHLSINDNGVGFDPDGVIHSHMSRGLSGMQERVQLMGGSLHIESSPGQGTTIDVAIPLDETQ